jgi:hypothetical protein
VSNAPARAAGAASVGLAAAEVAGSMAAIPGIGMAVSAANIAASKAARAKMRADLDVRYGEHQQKFDYANNRMAHVYSIYHSRCAGTAQAVQPPAQLAGGMPTLPDMSLPDDDKLSCEQLRTESARREAEMIAMNKRIGDMAMASTSVANVRGAGLTSGMAANVLAGMLPGVGNLARTAVTKGTQAAQGAAQAASGAQTSDLLAQSFANSARHSHLQSLISSRCAAKSGS